LIFTRTERLTIAQRLVAEGQRAIERQRELIRKEKSLGNNTADAEKLLARLERSQRTFEDDLARISAQRE
jgi:hypothetical protein